MLHITMMEIGKVISELRKKKGISQNKLSRLAGMSRSYLHRLENDLLSPRVDTLERIAKALGVKMKDSFK